jgi:hypothetical protein
MNTLISYMYRDASNYKAHGEEVLQGTLTSEQKEAIIAKLEGGENFIPDQVGLEEVQEQLTSFPSEDDHVWHELNEDDITDTQQDPTIQLTAEQLYQNFMAVEEWDVEGAVERLGL